MQFFYFYFVKDNISTTLKLLIELQFGVDSVKTSET